MNMKKLTALLLAAMMLLPMAMAQETADAVLATVEDTQILQSQADALMPTFVSYEYVSSEADYQTVVTYLVQQELLKRKIADMQFDQFTQEEESALRNDAQVEWDAALEEYVQYYLAEDTDEGRATARAQAEDFYAASGLTVDLLYQNLLYGASVDKMTDYLVGGYEPTQEEVQGVFQEVGAQYQAQYENDIASYEYMTQYYGQSSWYTPAGYRGIIHILLKADAAVMEQYTAMQAAYEDQQAGADEEQVAGETAQPTQQAVVTEPVTPEQVEEARQVVLASQKAKLNEIDTRLENGESFESLVAEFGEDPGMEDPANLAYGYLVHADSIVWDPTFTSAAFSDRMTKVGDVSDPVVGSNGIHILYYLRDVPSGLVLTNEISTEIADYLKTTKENEAFTQAFASWENEMKVAYDDANILAASQAAQKRLAAEEAQSDEPDTTEPQVVPSQEDETLPVGN